MSMKKSVLQICHYAAPYRGNFVASLEALEKILLQKGYTTVYLFPEWAKTGMPSKWLMDMEKEGKVIKFFGKNAIKNTITFNKIIKQYGVVLIHTHFLPVKYQVAVQCACLRKPIRVIVHYHNHSEIKQGVQARLRQIFYRKCCMIACSDSVYQSVQRDYPKNEIYCVENGIDPSRVNNFRRISAQEMGFKAQAPIAIMFGFDYKRKGVDIACEAVKQLNRNGIRINLGIVLSTNMEQVRYKLNKQFGDMIPDWIAVLPSRLDVASWYQSSQLFLSPSREEGLPYSVLEAGFCKCVVVLSDIPAQKNLEIPYTVWFESENAGALAQAIEKALKLYPEKEKNIWRSQQQLLKKYSVQAWAEQISLVYRLN